MRIGILNPVYNTLVFSKMRNITIEIKWALIFIVMMMSWMVFEKAMGWHDVNIASHGTMTNLIAIPSILIYVLALRDKKINFHSGEMNYKEGFISGVIISVIITFLTPLSQFVIHKFITPDYFNNIIEYAVNTGETTREEGEAYFNLENYIRQAMLGALIMGVLTSFVVAAFVRTKK